MVCARKLEFSRKEVTVSLQSPIYDSRVHLAGRQKSPGNSRGLRRPSTPLGHVDIEAKRRILARYKGVRGVHQGQVSFIAAYVV